MVFKRTDLVDVVLAHGCHAFGLKPYEKTILLIFEIEKTNFIEMFFSSDVPWALYAPPPFDLWLEPKLKLGHYHFLDTHVKRKNICNLQQFF